MTTYHLDLSERADVPGERDRTIAALATEDKTIMAATLRAAADQLDPPKPPRPMTRGRSNLIDFDDPALRGAVVNVEPWMRRQAGGTMPEREHASGCESIHAMGTPCLPPRSTRIATITPDDGD